MPETEENFPTAPSPPRPALINLLRELQDDTASVKPDGRLRGRNARDQERASRQKSRERDAPGAAAQSHEAQLTGEGAVSEAGVAGHRSQWDSGAGGRRAVGKHLPEGKSGEGEADERGPPGPRPPSPHLATHK